MMYKFALVFIVAVVVNRVEGGCECEYPTTHYDALGCEPIFKNTKDCCPTYYDCSKRIEVDRKSDICYFQGKTFKQDQRVDEKLTAVNCIAGCFCRKDDTLNRDFICAHIDCPEFFGRPPLPPACYRSYDLDQCCSTGVVCPPFIGRDECRVGDKTFQEGQRFSPPDDDCVSCVCQKGFEGKYESPFCRPVQCGFGLLKKVNVISYCAPVYYGNSKCCPIQWECKPENQEIGIPFVVGKADLTRSCRYGDSILQIGEKFDLKGPYSSSPKIGCICSIPPLVTCKQEK